MTQAALTVTVPVTRIDRVQTVLRANPALNPHTFPADFSVAGDAENESRSYAECVVKIAEAIEAEGSNICTLNKAEIVKKACEYLGIDSATVVPKAKKAKAEPASGKPSESRYRRVNSILMNSTARDFLAKETVVVSTIYGDVNMSVDVVALTEAIHAEGINACLMSKEDVYAKTEKFLQGQGVASGKIVQKSLKKPQRKRAPRAVNAASVPEAAKSETKPTLPVATDTPAVMVSNDEIDRLEKVLKDESVVWGRIEKSGSVHVNGCKPTHALVYSIAEEFRRRDKDVVVMPAAEIVEDVKKMMGYTQKSSGGVIDIRPEISIYSLLVGAEQLMGAFDKSAGHESRLSKIKGLIEEFHAVLK